MSEFTAKSLKDNDEIKSSKRKALQDEAIALKKEDMAKQALEVASTKEEL